MIIGDRSTFAIESGITQAYKRLGFRALGYFVLHIGGLSFGVPEADATLLAAAFNKAGIIISDRGKHTAPFSSDPNAGAIVDAIGKAIYGADPGDERFFGMSAQQFDATFKACQWHRNCDEAFDDGSAVYLFDVEDRVRLIANRPPAAINNYSHDPETLRDVWLRSDEFYQILETWRTAFEAEWRAASKIAESDDGAEGD